MKTCLVLKTIILSLLTYGFEYFRKECGLEKFVPVYERSTIKIKDLRKLLTHQMKLNQHLTAPGQKQLTAVQAKLHYMKIVSEQKTFGSRVFMVTLVVSYLYTQLKPGQLWVQVLIGSN
jgi:hypothetical protein